MRVRFAALSALALLASQAQALYAQPAAAPAAAPASATASDKDLAAIQQSATNFADAFNRGDAKAVAALWTPDGEYVTESGEKYVGRAEIEKGYAEFFAANPKATLRLMIDSLRLLSPDAAIEDGEAILDPPAGAAPTASTYSVVHVRVDGRWLMASVRDAAIDSGSAYENIADLEWLIGTWTAESQGVQTESVCRWLGEKSFVERRYTIKATDGAETTGLQIIGWNAQERHVQSWNFSPDGASAIGVWSPTEDGWQAAVRGATADGAPTTALNRLQRLDDNAYVWQSVDRTVGSTLLPDSDEVVIRRKSAK